MNEDIKSKWVAALRSGDYEQTEAYLRTAKGFCCLGVLCDLADNKKWSEKIKTDFDGGKHFDYSNGYRSYPPQDVYDWAGITDDIADYQIEKIVGMNDKGSTFKEIANYIEKNL